MATSKVTTAPDGATTPALDLAGTTRVGRERDQNEDAYLIATLQRSMLVHDANPDEARGWFSGEQAGTLLLVADGMGGQGDGDIASRVAVRTIAGYLLNVMPWLTPRPHRAHLASGNPSFAGVRDELSSALALGDYTVKQTGARVGNRYMGTTLTAALLLWPLLYVAHVGDSRCDLLRSGQLLHLTTEHTLANRLAEESSGAEPPARWHHLLWNAVGGDDEIPVPELRKMLLQGGDLLLLCSDGLSKHLSDREIVDILGQPGSNADRSRKLLERAIERGSPDDVTIVLAGTAG